MDLSKPRRPGSKPTARRRPAGRPGPDRAAASAPAAEPVPGLAARSEALRLLAGTLGEGRMLSDMARSAPAALAPEDRARAGALAAATLRHLGQCDAVIRRFARKVPPLEALNALRVAAAELHVFDEKPHAVVDGAVGAVKTRPSGARLAGLVNAVARKLSSEGAPIWAAQDAPRTNMPGWLWGRLGSAYGGAATRRIAQAHLRAAPLDLTPRDPSAAAELAERLDAAPLPTGSLRVARRTQVSALPGFEDGAWWVQDMAAALPARLLGDVAGARVLDLCAAPGGKTLQLAAAGAQVTALDISERRLERLRENLARTGLAAEIVAADALDWTPDAPFDAILLDAPCSATGTIRRHPDLPHHKPGPDVGALARLQDALLDRAWGWLREGGALVFATCSLLPEEGEHRSAAFAARTADARPVRIDPAALGGAPHWVNAAGELRLRPDFQPSAASPDAEVVDFGGMDGFFAASFLKRT